MDLICVKSSFFKGIKIYHATLKCYKICQQRKHLGVLTPSCLKLMFRRTFLYFRVKTCQLCVSALFLSLSLLNLCSKTAVLWLHLRPACVFFFFPPQMHPSQSTIFSVTLNTPYLHGAEKWPAERARCCFWVPVVISSRHVFGFACRC